MQNNKQRGCQQGVWVTENSIVAIGVLDCRAGRVGVLAVSVF